MTRSREGAKTKKEKNHAGNFLKEKPSKMTYEKLGFTETGETNVSQREKISVKKNENISVILEKNFKYDGNQEVVQKNTLSSNKTETGTNLNVSPGSNPFAGLADASSTSCNPFLNNSNPFLTNDDSNNPFCAMPNDSYGRTNSNTKNPFLSGANSETDVRASKKEEKNLTRDESSKKENNGESKSAFDRSNLSPFVSPASSPRPSRSRLFKESRRISIDKTGHYLHLNQYRLLDSIGEVSRFFAKK